MTSLAVSSKDDLMLPLIFEALQEFHALRNFIETRQVNTANIFTPVYLNTLATEIETHKTFVEECITFLDIVNLYSFMVYDSEEKFVTGIKKLILSSRLVKHTSLQLNASGMDEYVFEERQSGLDFIESNSTLLSVFIACLVVKIFTADKR